MNLEQHPLRGYFTRLRPDFAISVLSAGVTSEFNFRHLPPRILRCTFTGCTGTGINLHQHIHAAFAQAARDASASIHYHAIDECMGTLLHDGRLLRVCAFPFHITIQGALLTPFPPPPTGPAHATIGTLHPGSLPEPAPTDRAPS